MVFIEGVYQNPSDFTLSGTTLTLDAAPSSGRKIVAYQVTEVEMDVISDNAVGISQLNVSDGSSGQVLQTDGSGTLSFGDVGGGGSWNFISATSIGANTSSVELTLSNYNEYVVRFSGINAGTSEFFPRLELRDSGQSNYSTLHYRLLSNVSGGSPWNFGASDSSVPLLADRVDSADGNFSGEFRIANVPGQPTVFGNAFCIDQYSAGTAAYIHYVVGLAAASGTEVFNKVKIRNNSGNMQAGTVYLYGITTS
jgi:hypothetical protein